MGCRCKSSVSKNGSEIEPSQWAGAYFRLYELSQEVWWYPGDQGYCGNHPKCLDKSQNLGFLRNSIFGVLGGPKKLFWAPETLFWLRNPTFWGGHKVRFLRQYNVFWGPKKLFWDPKTLLGLRNLPFGGIILLKLFDLSNGLGVRNYQNSHFWAKSAMDISETTAWIKKF